MDFDRGHASPHRWSQVRRLELCSGIRSLEDYEQAVSTGNLNAIAFLREVDTLHGLRIGDVRHVHYLTFEQVHPWAGQFRRPGQLVTVSGFPAADPPRIKREVSLALVQTEELFDEARTEEDGLRWLAALAFFHVRFERIHPFLDGNGRTGRILLAAQFEAVFGKRPSFANQKDYRGALQAASRNNLAPLMNYLGASIGLAPTATPWRTRFRLAPRFLEEPTDEPSFLDDIAWSRTAHD
jgi:fido (protein-threonine AMPylation protein)